MADESGSPFDFNEEAEGGERVFSGGVDLFDQGQARALDALRRSDVIFLVTGSTETGTAEVMSLIPQPEGDRNKKWLGRFLDLAEETLQTLREELGKQ